MTLNLIPENVHKVVADFPEISLVYLFGSQVTENIGPLSDIDLGVLVDHAAMDLDLQPR